MTQLPFPSPMVPAGSRSEVFLGYLDYFRSVVVAKVEDLDDDELRHSRLGSGWTPIELVRHLTYVERRWLVWGFEGQPLPDPWGDQVDGRWTVAADDTREQVLAELGAQAAETTRIVSTRDLTDVGRPGERWEGGEPATLERVLFHLLQEYARHAGHLDVVRELIDGRVGE